MAREIAIPESVASDLAVAASKAVADQIEQDYNKNAEKLADAAEELITASQKQDDGKFVSVSVRAVSGAAGFCEYDVDAGNKARAFLENQNVW